MQSRKAVPAKPVRAKVEPVRAKAKAKPAAAGDDASAAVLDGLRRIVRALRLSSRSAEKYVGVSGAQLFVLHCIEKEPLLSIKDLAKATLTDASSVSVIVARLVEGGYVLRREHPEDARRAVLTLTAGGRAAISASPDPIQAMLVHAVATLP